MLKKSFLLEQFGFAYTEPDENSLPVSDLVAGSMLPIISSQEGFLQVAYPDGCRAWVNTEEVTDMMQLFSKPFLASEMVRTAQKFNGIPYLWGGSSSKAMDCSGLTSIAYYLNGIIVMRDANQQSVAGRVVSTSYRVRIFFRAICCFLEGKPVKRRLKGFLMWLYTWEIQSSYMRQRTWERWG